MKPGNDFDTMKEMAKQSMDIRVAPLSQIIEVKTNKKGGQITIGVDRQTVMDFMAGKQFCGGLFLADFKQFEEIREKETK